MYKSFCAVGACFWVSPAGCQCNGFKMRQRPPYWSQCLQAAVLSVVRRVRIKVGKGEQKTEDGSCELSNICLSWQDSFFFFFLFFWSLCSELRRKQTFFSSLWFSKISVCSSEESWDFFSLLPCTELKTVPLLPPRTPGRVPWGDPFPSESPAPRWNVAPSTPPALQRAGERRRWELMPRISEEAFPCRELF